MPSTNVGCVGVGIEVFGWATRTEASGEGESTTAMNFMLDPVVALDTWPNETRQPAPQAGRRSASVLTVRLGVTSHKWNQEGLKESHC